MRCDVAALPVLVFVHGGAFLLGCGRSAVFGPDPLMAHNMVVVTLNYRLGALGFANLNTAGVPGNAGLKDLLLALRWVRDNVRAFCGDPGLVTLAGHGAGAAGVELLGLSPLSAGG
ncbi:hypothetical protein ONE63_006027 [Megalurothrips usitatus]|uniref:Carboxylesterase type B domain-containing protein n=1 Tax=Megalurothrips usitatus TaxID=439358 RepID=A0AAV7XYI2_9NEOP|nr:hypothetical protein ONE63_006027 [Megalurothrips usitatus]